MAPTSDKSGFEFSAKTRQTFWGTLVAQPDKIWNFLIVGGGVVGAGVLRELALREVTDVLLVEKNDFASATSGASSKLIHAGIRYLEQVWMRLKRGDLRDAWTNFRFVLDASRERKILTKLAPRLIVSKPIYLVVGTLDNRSVLSVWLGVHLYWLIQLLQGQVFPLPKVLLRQKAIRWAAPELKAEKVKAIFGFWDAETDDARLVLATIQNACKNGVMAMNYVELVRYVRVEGGLKATLRNKETGETATILTKMLINAAGPEIDDVRSLGETPADSSPLVDRVAGSHLNVYPPLTRESYYVTAGDGRLVFVLNRTEEGFSYTRIGTTERTLSAEEKCEGIQPTEMEIGYLKELVGEFFVNSLRDENVISADAGVRPLRSQHGHQVFQKTREHAVIRDGNVIHVVGVKLTDFRRVATEIIDDLPFREKSIPARNIDRSEDAPIRDADKGSIYEGSVEDAVQESMVVHWDDYVFRRRGLSNILRLKSGDPELISDFERMAAMLSWDENRKTSEKSRALRSLQK